MHPCSGLKQGRWKDTMIRSTEFQIIPIASRTTTSLLMFARLFHLRSYPSDPDPAKPCSSTSTVLKSLCSFVPMCSAAVIWPPYALRRRLLKTSLMHREQLPKHTPPTDDFRCDLLASSQAHHRGDVLLRCERPYLSKSDCLRDACCLQTRVSI